MVVIGVDPHKRQHTAAVVEQPTQRQLPSAKPMDVVDERSASSSV
jgi:hypothetical protein